jgi:adenylate cyclase
MFFGLTAHLVLLTAAPDSHGGSHLRAYTILALYFGFFSGLVTGLIDVWFERRFFYKKALGIIILFKSIIALILFIILISFIRYAIYPYLMNRFFAGKQLATDQRSWDAFFQFLLLYTIVAGIVISFFNQINRKFGPGVLVPLLLGKYRKPKEEEKIFLFMDLSSSTAIAEKLGHLKYSAFIRDSFMDINQVISKYNGQIYQYVGDEIVILWSQKEGMRNLSCIRFFFACTTRFAQRSEYYLQQYGQVPHFKAGLHLGKVTAVEVGDLKRDIAYHGDTINTAARIHSVCQQYGQPFILSHTIVGHQAVQEFYDTTSLGLVGLNGKSMLVELFSIRPRSNSLRAVS